MAILSGVGHRGADLDPISPSAARVFRGKRMGVVLGF